MSVGPDPEKRLHANRPGSVPYTTDGSEHPLSRGDILLGEQRVAFGSDQSLGIVVDGENKLDLSTHPQKWPEAGFPLIVPKCVILSSLPYWTAYWKSTYFYGPSDVVGQMFTSPFLFGNYYYFDQWNDVDPDQEVHDTDPYCNTSVSVDCGGLRSDSGMGSSGFWSNFDPPVSEADKSLFYDSTQRQQADLPPSPQDHINETNDPPATRYNEIIGHIRSNPYYEMHRQIMATFRRVKELLESDPVDPIYVTIPEWMPEDIQQTRNGSLTKPSQKLNTAHGTGCDIVDVIPCYTAFNVPWGPPYPDVDDPRNQLDFNACNVPWLATCDPGFGTNVLHMFVGHPCVRYSTGNSIFDYQAWPLSPEGVWIGPVFIGSYTGAGLPFFKGRREIWRDFGFAYGFTGGAQGVYNNYSSLIESASSQYKEQFWKYRNFATRLFTYPATWSISWDTQQLWSDQKHDCHSTQFYFGFAFADFQQEFSNEDNWYADCSGSPGAGPTHIKFAEHIGNDPASQSIRDAIDTFYPPIQRRVEAYYQGIEAGCAEYYAIAIETNGLADYNVEYGGSFAPLLDADALAAYIRAYFNENP